jgi:hypothetical protein
MRKSLLMAAAAASAMLVMAPAAAALAAPAPHHVLTIRRVGGPNVAVRAVLQAGLKPRTVLTFSQVGGTLKITCARSTFTSRVVANPVRPGTAVLSLTGQTFAGCRANSTAVHRVLSITVRVPDRTTISDARGFPVTVFAPRATIKLSTIVGNITCVYSARRIGGHASNVGSLISFLRQVFNRAAGSNGLCPARGALTATYGPVVDMSVLGHPHVFVN